MDFIGACRNRDLKLVKTLIDSQTQNDLNYGFYIACGLGYLEIVKILLKDVTEFNDGFFGHAVKDI